MAYTWLQFRNAVKGLMSDASLNDTTAIAAIAEFVKSKIALNVDKNPALAAAHMANWITQRNRMLGYTVTLSKDNLRSEIDKLLTVDSTRHGIQDFIDDLILTAKNDLAGLSTWINSVLRQGVIELERYIPFYRGNHETRYTVTDVSEEGEASRGTMPDQAMIQDSYYVKDGEPCIRMPIAQYDWENRFDLKCGSPRMMGKDFFIAINPTGSEFLLFPPILEDNYVSVFWDGVKLSFADGDTVPFDETFADAVANYVLYKMYLRPDSLNAKMSANHFLIYKQIRLELYRDSRDRVIVRFKNDSPMPSTGGCGTGCAVEDTTGSFDEGGVVPDAPIIYS